MSKLTYTIEPQRRGAGWEPCAFHQAQRFAVIQTKHWTRGRQKFTSKRVMASFDTKAAAEALCNTLTSASKPRPRPKLGARFARSGRDIIARSLTQEQYHKAMVRDGILPEEKE